MTQSVYYRQGEQNDTKPQSKGEINMTKRAMLNYMGIEATKENLSKSKELVEGCIVRYEFLRNCKKLSVEETRNEIKKILNY